MKLQNGIIGLEFDARTGSLISVEDKRGRVVHRLGPKYARLFRVCVPDEERWMGRYADSHESGKPGMERPVRNQGSLAAQRSNHVGRLGTARPANEQRSDA